MKSHYVTGIVVYTQENPVTIENYVFTEVKNFSSKNAGFCAGIEINHYEENDDSFQNTATHVLQTARNGRTDVFRDLVEKINLGQIYL